MAPPLRRYPATKDGLRYASKMISARTPSVRYLGVREVYLRKSAFRVPWPKDPCLTEQRCQVESELMRKVVCILEPVDNGMKYVVFVYVCRYDLKV